MDTIHQDGKPVVCSLFPSWKASFEGLPITRIASKIVQGYLCTPVESLCEVSITDVVSKQKKLSLLKYILIPPGSFLRMSVEHILECTRSFSLGRS
jgi:hypothetical protein